MKTKEQQKINNQKNYGDPNFNNNSNFNSNQQYNQQYNRNNSPFGVNPNLQ